MMSVPQTRRQIRRWVEALPPLERERLAAEARAAYPGLDARDVEASFSLGVAMYNIARNRPHRAGIAGKAGRP